MAFIRKHRLVLVPLFVVAVIGAGLVFLLRSRSEEPGGAGEPGGNVSSTYPRETAADWQEDVSKRFEHGREYRAVRTVERVDPETEEVVTDTLVSTVRERGTNICCKDEAGQWVPTIAEWEDGGLGFRMKRNNWQIEVPLRLGDVCEYTVGGRTLAMRPGALVLSDGAHTVSLGTLDTTVQGQIDPDDPSRLVFADVLGENSGVDIELVLECAALHQNVVLRNKPSLPEGFDEESARLYVYTELGLDAFTADGAVGVAVGETPVDVSSGTLATARNEHDPITFTARETVDGQECETVLHWFAESRVWDRTGAENETCAARQLWRDPNTLKTYLVESVPHSYIADAIGAVTLDYVTPNSSITTSQTWTADATYYITSNVTIGQNGAVTIEPGTVIKFAGGKRIDVTGNGAKIIAKGEPLRWIVFTSDQDDQSGQDLTEGTGDPDPGDYDAALHVSSSADGTATGCAIEYCKIGYATDGLRIDRDMNDIRHCIIRDSSSRGIECTGTGAPSIFNCLIVDAGSVGYYTYSYYQTFSFTVTNCTFDNCGIGLCMMQTPKVGGSLSMTGYNNLFANNTTLGVNSTCLSGTRILDHNGWYNNYQDVAGISKGANEHNYGGTSPYTGYTGYNSSPLGEYFIQVVCTGTQTADYWYGDGTKFDVGPPTAVSSDITTTTTWNKRNGDTGTVDIGYHHPRVDKVITGGTVECDSCTLTIAEGVVVAFNDSSWLEFINGAALTCNGAAASPIRMVGGALASQQIRTPDYANEDNRLLSIATSGNTSITRTHFTGAGNYALTLASDFDANDHVEHCTFALSTGGILVQDCNVALKNLLFDLCWEAGISADFNNETHSLEVRNATFSRSEDGVGIALSGNGYEDAALTVKDCLFTKLDTAQNYEVEFDDGAAVDENVDVDFNAYWECNHLLLEDGDIVVIGPNSMVLSETPYDDGWADWGDRWYLLQDETGTTRCVNAGSQSAWDAGLGFFTTKLSDDAYFDVGAVDIGYHYDPGYEEDVVDEITITNVYCGGNDLRVVVNSTNENGEYWVLTITPAGDTTPVYSIDSDGARGDIDETISSAEWDDADDGTYFVTISADTGSSFQTFSFYVYLDRTPPDSVTILSPESGSTVIGY